MPSPNPMGRIRRSNPMLEARTAQLNNSPVAADPGLPSGGSGSHRVRCMAGITTPGHCCWIDGEVCRFLRDDGPEAYTRWICRLREELGSWEVVHADPRYLETVAPTMRTNGQADCGDWPGPGITCGECGVTNHG